MIHPVLLCGGSGTRLWPLSRQALPKQFLPLLSSHSLLQETLLRLEKTPDLAPALVVCNHEHRFLVADQLSSLHLPVDTILLEPAARNTAPAVALAAFHVAHTDPQGLMLVLPSDHSIKDAPAFSQTIENARQLAEADFLTTFGIVPDKPETGFGYIERGEAVSNVENGFRVARFVEKPDAARAQEFLATGNFFWNSGMFAFKAATFLAELQICAPEIYNAVKESFEKSQTDLDFLRPDEEAFLRSPSVSIDYAVMEKTARAAVVPAQIGWSDVGSYAALWEVESKDNFGNAIQGEVAVFGSKNNYVHAEKQLVTLLGVEDMVVVVTADAILITKRECSQDVKQVVDRLKAEGRVEHEIHKKVYRPWGWYEGVERGERFQVKQLVVKPGQKSSMQVHHHRSEHWVIVKGTAEITLGKEKHLLTEDQSIYIPLGVPHRIFNPGMIPMHFIEVQSGSYLEEDDIVRIDDEYGR